MSAKSNSTGRTSPKLNTRNARKSAVNSAPLTVSGDRTYTEAGLAEIGRRVVADHAAHEALAKLRAERAAQAEREEAEGITLQGPRLDLTRTALDEININLLSVYQLAIGATCTSDVREADAYLTAVQSIAKLCCRRVDFIAELVGGDKFGNFEESFDVTTAVRHAEMDAQREAEADND